MGQEHKEYTWNLIARKLNGEATPEELLELERLLRENPGLHYPLQTITDLWQSAGSDNRKEARQEAAYAFDRHLERMETLQIDFPAATSNPGDPGEPESITGAEYPDQPKPNRKRGLTRILVTAACLSLTLAGAWLYRGAFNKPPVATNTPQRPHPNRQRGLYPQWFPYQPAAARWHPGMVECRQPSLL